LVEVVAYFAASISRRAKDKQTGVGKLHIMKNRYGMDGLTYNAAINIAHHWNFGMKPVCLL